MSTSSQTSLTGQQLVEIRTRTKAATAGRWHLRLGDAYSADTLLTIVGEDEVVVCALDFSRSGSGARLADRSFIVQAHRDVPVLLDEVERLQRTYTFDTAELKREADRVRMSTIAEVRRALLGTTDGGEVDDSFEIPAGEIARILNDLAGGAR